MAKLPEVVALMLCEKLNVDTQTGQVSLVGIFNSLRFADFPTAPQSFTVYVALLGGAGEGKMKLVINRLETESDIYAIQKWVAFPNRWMIVNLEIRLRECVFPSPGRYSLQLCFDDRDLAQRYLDIIRTRS